MKMMLRAAALAFTMLAAGAAEAQDRYTGTFSTGTSSISYTLLFNTGFTGSVTAADLLSGSTFSFVDPLAPKTFTYNQATNGTSTSDPNGTSPGFVFYSTGATVGGGKVTFDFSNSAAVFGVADRATGGADYYFCAAGSLFNCAIEAPFGGGFVSTPNTIGGTIAGGTQTIATAVMAAVPEPASWAMMIVGTGLVGGALRGARRRRPAMAAAA